jgi:beta-galactosidase
MPLAAMIAALLAAVLAVPASARGAEPPSPVDLAHAGWEYAAGARPVRWEPVTLPHVTNPNPTAQSFGGGVGWYRVRLRAPSRQPGFAWAIRFAQVRRVATVFLDGRPLTTSDEPYAPFSVTLPALNDGRRHELRVRVDWRKGREPREGWWNWGGITRPAELVPVGGLVTRDPGFLPQRTCTAGATTCSWSVLVDAVVANRGTAPARPRLAFTLRGPGGAPAAARTVAARPLVPHERARVRFSVPVTGDARLWAPGHPALYDAQLRTLDGDRVQQVDRARVGLRTVAVRHGLLELNGRPVQLRGASIQEDVAGHGAALTDADIAATVRELRDVGANLTRAHYALDERLLRALDAAGILVWSQAPVYHRDVALRSAGGRARALGEVRAEVLATRSHPSVLTHSVANELSTVPDERPGTAAFLRDARAVVADLDPTVPVSVDTLSYPGFPAQRAYAAFDLLGINSYFGWYDGKPDHSTSNLADLAPYLRRMRRDYPRQGLVVTEFGAESTMPGPASVKETYGFQARYARRVLAMIDAAPGISGALWWTLREFAVKPGWDGGAGRVDPLRDAIHNKGLITYAGLRKPAFAVVRDAARRTPLYPPLPAGPAGHRGSPWPALGLTALLLALLALDAWALLGWRAARRTPAPPPAPAAAVAAASSGGGAEPEPERPPLRLVA